MIDFLETEYASTLHKIANLVDHGEITFDLLWAIFLPQSVVFTSCHTTSEPRALRLQGISRCTGLFETPYWSLTCQYLEANEKFPSVGQQFRLASMTLEIPQFDGVVKIAELSAYPIDWHPRVDEVRAQLIRRGRKWIELTGVHHKRYTGVAYKNDDTPGIAHYIDSRIMIDLRKVLVCAASLILNCTSLLGTFSTAQPDYFQKSRSGIRERATSLLAILSTTQPDYLRKPAIRILEGATAMNVHDFQADQVMLASPILYGFSLADKLWCSYTMTSTLVVELICSYSGV